MNINKITEFKDGLPLIKCTRRPDGYGLRFYCSLCKKAHRHGHGNGSRVSHCPNYEGEYYIELDE